MANAVPAATPSGFDSDTESRSKKQSILIIALIALMTEIVAFEFTLISPGLTDMAIAFKTNQVGLVMTVPLLVGGVVVPILGKLADVHGKKKMLMWASAFFLLGTAICATVTNFNFFLVGRGLQAVGLASAVICYGLIRDLIPARWVPLGVGGIGVGIGASSLGGPLIGGWLIDNHGFRSAFWFLFVYSAVVILATAVFVPESKVRINHTIDYLGAALLGLGASSLIFGAIRPDYRAVAFTVGVAMIIAFIVAERRIDQPLISMGLLSRPGVWMTLLIAACYGVYNGANGALMPQMLRTPAIPGNDESGLGFTATGYAMHYGLPSGLAAAICGILGGWLARRYSPRFVMIFALTMCLLTAVLIGVGAVDTPSMTILVAMVAGTGMGLYFVASTNLLIEAVPANTQAVTGSMKFTSEQVSGALSSAFLGALAANYVLMLNPTTQQPISSVQGFEYGYLICAVVLVVGIGVALIMRHGRTPATGGVSSNQTENSVSAAQLAH
ncbi:MFS transporter [Rhodococcus sp. OK302]|uniref:MFS transporter n=1 Tax=Rhodococcus sp. OK302 TaxID=1882769 RepID=UPI001595B77F|nr:MFS transporter [Rhodococcus sp. OK302]